MIDLNLEQYMGQSPCRQGTELTIDYLILSSYGAFVIKLGDLKYRYCGLFGNENEPYWTHVLFGRMFLPFVGSLGTVAYQFGNPMIQAKRYASTIRNKLPKDLQEYPIVPIVVIQPRVKAINIRQRKKGSWIIYPCSLDN